jgi:hypothetical protein
LREDTRCHIWHEKQKKESKGRKKIRKKEKKKIRKE